VAQGIATALEAYFADRPLVVRFDALIPGGEAGLVPTAVGGSGPPFWAAGLRRAELAAGVRVRVTNTGTQPWPSDLRVLAAWEANTEPYLRQPPDTLDDIGLEVPPLAPGESVVLVVKLDVPVAERGMLWVTLGNGGASLSDLGSAPLQLSTSGP
jgi:hypothetical protein